MALGLNIGSSESGDFTKIIKFDARAGRMFKVEREQDSGGSWQTENVEITNGFTAVMDLENLEVGWALYAPGVAPSVSFVKLGQALPAKPSDQHKQAFKMMLKLGKSSGGDVRELSATSKAVIGSVDDLHTQYEAEKGKHPGKLPVVELTGSTAIVSTGQGKSSTNYAPQWSIRSWIDRPSELGGAGGEAKEEPKPEPVKQPEPVAAEGDEEF